MDHDALVKDAERLSKKLSAAERSDQSFIWSYVGNHELRFLWNEVKHIKALLMGIGIPVLIAVVLGLMKQFIG